LPPTWVELPATRGIEALHWSLVGELRATDALESGAIVTIDEIAARVRILPIRRELGGEGQADCGYLLGWLDRDAAGPDRMRPYGASSLRGIAVNDALP
jgi:hypothetical protein